MAWDHDADVLYWASSYNTSYFQTYRYLWTLDTATGKATRVNTAYAGRIRDGRTPPSAVPLPTPGSTGLYIVPGPEASGAAEQQ